MLTIIKKISNTFIKPPIIFFSSLLFLMLLSIFLLVLNINFCLKGLLFGILFILTSWIFSLACTGKLKTQKIIYASHSILLASFLTLGTIAIIRHNKSFLLDNGKATMAVIKTVLSDKTNIKNLPSKQNLLTTFFRLELKRLLNQKPQTPFIENVFGFNMITTSYNHTPSLLHEIFINKDYYVPLDNNAPFIIDCGCFRGFSILFFKMLYPGSEILGFEAHPKNFKILEENIKSNNLPHVTLHNKAVYNSTKPLSFSLESTLGSKVEDKSSNNVISVESVLLSDYINKPVDLLKMDIEGAETAVIQDLSKNKKLHLIKNIAMEFHYDDSNKNSLAQILTTLENAGFSYQVNKGSKKAGNAMLYAYRINA